MATYRDLTPEELEQLNQLTQPDSSQTTIDTQSEFRDLTPDELQQLQQLGPTEEQEGVGFGTNVLRTFGGAARDLTQNILDMVEGGPGIEFGDDPSTEEVETGIRFVRDVPRLELPEVAEPTYFGGSFVRDATQFLLPFQKLKFLSPKTWTGRISETVARGVAAEQIAFSPFENRLSNLIQSFPGLQNPVTEYLQADPDDSVAEARFKMAIEGGITGLVADSAIEAIIRLVSRVRGSRNKNADDAATKQDESGEIIDKDVKAQQAADNAEAQGQPRPFTDDVQTNFQSVEEQALKPKKRTKGPKWSSDVSGIETAKIKGNTYKVQPTEDGKFTVTKEDTRSADEIDRIVESNPSFFDDIEPGKLINESPAYKKLLSEKINRSVFANNKTFETKNGAKKALDDLINPGRLPTSLRMPKEPKVVRSNDILRERRIDPSFAERGELTRIKGDSRGRIPVNLLKRGGARSLDELQEIFEAEGFLPPQPLNAPKVSRQEEVLDIISENAARPEDEVLLKQYNMEVDRVTKTIETLEQNGFNPRKMTNEEVDVAIKKIDADDVANMEMVAAQQIARDSSAPPDPTGPDVIDLSQNTRLQDDGPPPWLPTSDVDIPIDVPPPSRPGGTGGGSGRRGEPDKAGNINLEKMDGPGGFEKLLKDTAKQNNDFVGETRGVVKFGTNGEELKALAKESGLSIEQLLKRKTGDAFNAETAFAARMILMQSVKNVLQLAKRVRSTKGGPEDLANFEGALARHAAIQEQVAGITAEAGRALRSFREIADSDGIVQERLIREYLDARGGEESIRKIAEKIGDLDSKEQVNAFVKDAYKPGFNDYIQEFWINALLSSPSTHFVNMTSNLLVAATRPFEYAIAAGIGSFRNAEDRITFTEVGLRTLGSIVGAVDGLVAGGRALWDPDSVTDSLTKLELQRQKVIPGVAGTIVRTPGRFLVAEDVLFKAIGYRQELWGSAFAQARKEGKGIQRAFEIMRSPKDMFPDIHLKAIDTGRYQTFTNPLGEGKIGYTGKLYQKAVQAVPVLRYITPFIRTPVNILRYSFERNPLLASFTTSYKEAIKKGGKEADLARAKMLFGTSIMTGVGAYAAAGMISGGGPADARENAVLRETGWQPYSVRVGDKWYQYNRFEPIGILFGITADLVEIGSLIKNEEDEIESSEIAAMLVASVTDNIVNKTFLTGLSDFMKILIDSERYGTNTVERFTSSFIPTVFYYQRKGEDPYLREVRNFTDAFKNRLGTTSKELPLRRNILGEAKEYNKGFGGRFSPLTVSDIKNDIVFDEFVELDITPAVPKRNVRGVELDSEQYSELLRTQKDLRLREQLETVIKDPNYQRLTKYAKRVSLEEILAANQEAARDILLTKYPDLLRKMQQQTIEELRE